MTVLSFFRIVSVVLAIVGAAMAFPLGAAAALGERGAVLPFLVPMAASIAACALLFLARGRKRAAVNFSTRSVFVFVSGTWAAICLFGAVPLVAGGYVPTPVDALFESVSGFTTTGATVIADVESLPRSVNLWRCEMHWLGGMGIIALTVALLPLLGVGGFQLIKAESTGPEKGKITPKMANTAKTLWGLYVGFTAAEAVCLMLCGMDVLDAVSHAFATLGTGGFSTRNGSIGAYGSLSIETVCTVFSFLGGVNFSLYFYLLARKFDEVRKNSELKAYVAIFAAVSLMLAVSLVRSCGSAGRAVRLALFQVASIMTTTGFSTADYTQWPAFPQFLIFVLFFVGGCSGSTAGGFKVVRWVVLAKQARNEVLRMLHPYGVFSVRLNGRAGRKDLVFSVAAFTLVYGALTLVTTAAGTLGGLDVFTAFTASLSMIGNVGPAFGTLGPADTFGTLGAGTKLWFSFAMVAGRLELYNIVIFLLPDYWRS